MKNFHLDKEERKINRDIARGKYVPVKDLEAEKAEIEREFEDYFDEQDNLYDESINEVKPNSSHK
jgi:hypothetical protein